MIKGDQHSRWGQREKKRPRVFERTRQPVSTPRKEKLLLAQLFCESERKIFPSRLALPQRLSLAFHCAEVGDMATPKPGTGMTHSQGLSLPPARVLLNTMELCQQGQNRGDCWVGNKSASHIEASHSGVSPSGRVCPSHLAPPTGY